MSKKTICDVCGKTMDQDDFDDHHISGMRFMVKNDSGGHNPEYDDICAECTERVLRALSVDN